jgi:acetyl-CoA carboxylase/biotin carboxylase 1
MAARRGYPLVLAALLACGAGMRAVQGEICLLASLAASTLLVGLAAARPMGCGEMDGCAAAPTHSLRALLLPVAAFVPPGVTPPLVQSHAKHALSQNGLAAISLPSAQAPATGGYARTSEGPLTPLRMVATEADVATDALTTYLNEHGGSLPIRRVLIANNGMAGTKAILSMRQWAYLELGDEKAIEFVAMATPEDLAANAEFIRLADAVVEVPGGVNRNNYANVDLIVSIAKKEKVDAVWPGWGHASENPALPRRLTESGIKFIGPTSPVMAALGDKIAANILAQTAGVPSIPWSGDGLTADLTSEGTIPEATFKKACVSSVEEAVAAAQKIGYPVMVKASEGGGGKGIRMSNNEEELRTNFVQVQNEVVGSPIFMMQLCTGARHIEVQIVGDEHGSAVALNGRDCSTQRRFQKIFEEGPPSIVPPEVFNEMELAAQRLTQSIGYCGAGTVEYLYNPKENKFFFLELNPRLQVEHPVTEGLTRANVPSVQLQVAMGIPLHRIPDIRSFYGLDRSGSSPIDFLATDYPKINNHVIAARITAENPDEGFKPTSGRIERVKFQSTSNVWGYFSVGANGGIHEYADSQFGHLFASGADRESARKSLILALKEIEVRGEIRTTVEYLVQLLETEAFKQNTIDTSWLDGLIREKSVGQKLVPHEVVTSAVIYRGFMACREKAAEYKAQLEKGQTGLIGLNTINIWPIQISYEGFTYSFKVVRVAPDIYKLSINGKTISVRVRQQPDGSLLASFGGVTHMVYGMEEPLGLRMVLDGKTVLLPNIFDPSELRSDITGKVVRYLQDNGGDVETGQPYVEVEAMKMIMPLKATASGKVRHSLSPGSIINSGDLLASLELRDPSQVKKILPFTGELDVPAVPLGSMDKDAVMSTLANTFAGYDNDFEPVVPLLFDVFDSAEELAEGVSVLLRKYLEVEQKFSNGSGSDAIIADMIKANKDNLDSVIATALAHQQLAPRTRLVCSLLRVVRQIIDRYGDWTPSESVTSTLEDLSNLQARGKGNLGSTYGEACILADELLFESRVAPFEKRVADLRMELFSEADADKVAESPSLSAGVDLLTALFDDEDLNVRMRAVEVYLRRAYRAHDVLDIKIRPTEDQNAQGCMMTVDWSFRFRGTPDDAPVRYGHMAVMKDFADLTPAVLDSLATNLEQAASAGGKQTDSPPVNVLHVAFLTAPRLDLDAELQKVVKASEAVLQDKAARLKSDTIKVRAVNFLFRQVPRQPRYLMFMECNEFAEDPLRRDMRPSFPYIFELKRMSDNYNLERLNAVARNSQIYLGVEKNPKNKRAQPQTVFLRALSHRATLFTKEGANRAMLSAMDELERIMLNPQINPTASSRIFLYIMPELQGDVGEIFENWKVLMDMLVARHATRMLRLNIDELEVKLRVASVVDGKKAVQPIRLVASSDGGQWLKPDAWREYLDPVTGETVNWSRIGEKEGTIKMDPYPNSNVIQMRRAAARRVGSTYAYDFLGLMKVTLIQLWGVFEQELKLSSTAPVVNTMPSHIFESDELVMQADGSLAKEQRVVGSNKIGMLAWHVTMRTPEYPEGREIVLICNDITVQSGSFGVEEDEFFKLASEYARSRGLPRIYISSNSGARIGLVEELKPKFKVAWNDESSPSQGFQYLYLSDADYQGLEEGTVNAHKVEVDGEVRWALDDIIGKVHGIGVENLRGSGMIAGETSRAYQDTFTLSYVTGRSVGIGAYLVRLGQRTIQMKNGPIILTGYSALNKLLGREVYTSQDQLGGPQIMHPNGVSHLVVEDDQEGVQQILNWLAYVPKTASDLPPILPTTDAIERPVAFIPPKGPYDPREMCTGRVAPDGSWQGGFFDRGSYREYLGGWGKSVIVGRARLGGIPFGVINVETRLSEQRIPADPANPESREVIQAQAGQVWFPDSAHKTAQAIRDFNNGENLPLMIFANWRGFSGGTRDMYGEILKFGAQIVDALVDYKHPVFVYIPPNGELRGGAWVVVDPTINEEVMEMYADKESRGGILEPPGICEVKFRSGDQMSKMHQLDPVLQHLDGELESAPTAEDATETKRAIKEREDAIMPLYLQVAHEFADLHDRAGRMKAKGVIRDIVDWPSSRAYFYWRARRLLAEKEIIAKFAEADSGMSKAATLDRMRSMCSADWEDDRAVLEWMQVSQGALEKDIMAVRREAVSRGVVAMLSGLSAEERANIISKL